jgi:hypothetical protein
MKNRLLSGLRCGENFFKAAHIIGKLILIGCCLVTIYFFWFFIASEYPKYSDVSKTVLKIIHIGTIFCFVGFLFYLFFNRLGIYLYNIWKNQLYRMLKNETRKNKNSRKLKNGRKKKNKSSK